MKKTENECVDCGLPCKYDLCPYYRVTRHYCDKCENEDVLYEWDDAELCIDCIKEELKLIEGSDY